MRGPVRVLTAVVLTLLGVPVAVASLFVARLTVHAGGVPLPWGLVLAVVAPAALFRAGGLLAGRAGGVVPALAWFAVVVVALLPGRGGDVVLAADGYGWSLLGLAVVVVIWAAVRSPTGRVVSGAEGSSLSNR